MVSDTFRFSLVLHLAMILRTTVLVNVIIARTRSVFVRESVLAFNL